MGGKVCARARERAAAEGTVLQNILKSPLMNIKEASGSQRHRYKFTKQRNVCVCAAEGLRVGISIK